MIEKALEFMIMKTFWNKVYSTIPFYQYQYVNITIAFCMIKSIIYENINMTKVTNSVLYELCTIEIDSVMFMYVHCTIMRILIHSLQKYLKPGSFFRIFVFV